MDDEVYGDAREEGFDRVIAVTPDDALNHLICQKAGLHFGEEKAFVVHGRPGAQDVEAMPPFEVNYAFAEGFYLTEAIQALDAGSARFEERHLDDSVPETVIPLFRILKSGGLEPVGAGQPMRGKYLCLVFDFTNPSSTTGE